MIGQYTLKLSDVVASENLFSDKEKINNIIRVLTFDSIEGFLFCLKFNFLPGWTLPEDIQQHHVFYKVKRENGELTPLRWADSIQGETEKIFVLALKDSTFRIILRENYQIHFSEVHSGNPKMILGVREIPGGYDIATDIGKYSIQN
ncbi:MAG: hypothetical protein AB1333_03045 [Patescibacteria group bacterium]